jgi:hypothetical protein
MEKSFDKYYVKIDRGTGQLQFDGDTPVLGELAKKDCRLEQRHVNILNASVKQSGVVYIEVKEIKQDTDKEERKALFAEAKELGLQPAKNIKTEDLRLLIENEKA